MSYDLMVFDPAVAPRDRASFKAWYEKQVDWPEDDSPYDPETSSPILRAWYKKMIVRWPNMQEVDDDDADDVYTTGYTFARHSIYLDFRWSVADEAYQATRQSAVECGVGFYDVSGDEGSGEIYFPGDTLSPPSTGAWRQVAADFKSGDFAKYADTSEPPKRRWFDFFRRNK